MDLAWCVVSAFYLVSSSPSHGGDPGGQQGNYVAQITMAQDPLALFILPKVYSDMSERSCSAASCVASTSSPSCLSFSQLHLHSGASLADGPHALHSIALPPLVLVSPTALEEKVYFSPCRDGIQL